MADDPQPPAGYLYHGRLFDDLERAVPKPQWVMFIWANLLALLPLSAGIVLLWVPYQVYLLSGTPWSLLPDPHWSTAVSLLVGAVILITSMVVHELLHGLALQLLGHKPRLLIQRGYLTASIGKGQFLNRQHYLIMSLTPPLTMTSLGGVSLVILPPTIGRLLLIALLLNTAASIGDLMVAVRVYRQPPSTLFADDRGIRVFRQRP